MIPTTANFQTFLSGTSSAPVFVLDLPTLGLRYATRGGQPDLAATMTTMLQPSGLSQQLQDLQAKTSIGTMQVPVVDVGRQILSIFPTTAWYGKYANLYIGFNGLAWADYMRYFSGVITSTMPTSDHTGWTFSIDDRKRTLRTQAYMKGDNGATPTSTSNPRTLDGNPLDLVLSLLETELGIAAADIDTGSISALRNGRFSCARMLFSVKKAQDALSWLEKELLLPNGLFHFARYDGRIAIGDMLAPPTPVSVVLAFTDSNTKGSPAITQKPIYNTVQVQLDYDGSNYLDTELFDDTDSLTKYGLQQQLSIQSQGLRTNLQGASRAGITARRTFLRYADGPAQMIQLTSTGLLSSPAEVGDYVTVSNSRLEDAAAGVMGWTNKVCQVMSVQPRFADHEVDFTLLDVSKSLRPAYEYADDTVPAWTSASAAQKSQYLFLANASSEQSDGSSAGGVY